MKEENQERIERGEATKRWLVWSHILQALVLGFSLQLTSTNLLRHVSMAGDVHTIQNLK
jgi:hypothetical protein